MGCVRAGFSARSTRARVHRKLKEGLLLWYFRVGPTTGLCVHYVAAADLPYKEIVSRNSEGLKACMQICGPTDVNCDGTLSCAIMLWVALGNRSILWVLASSFRDLPRVEEHVDFYVIE